MQHIRHTRCVILTEFLISSFFIDFLFTILLVEIRWKCQIRFLYYDRIIDFVWPHLLHYFFDIWKLQRYLFEIIFFRTKALFSWKIFLKFVKKITFMFLINNKCESELIISSYLNCCLLKPVTEEYFRTMYSYNWLFRIVFKLIFISGKFSIT